MGLWQKEIEANFNGSPTGQIWETLSIKIINDGNIL